VFERTGDILKKGKYKHSIGRTKAKSLKNVARELGIPLVGHSAIDEKMEQEDPTYQGIP